MQKFCVHVSFIVILITLQLPAWNTCTEHWKCYMIVYEKEYGKQIDYFAKDYDSNLTSIRTAWSILIESKL